MFLKGGLVEPKLRYKNIVKNPHLADWYFSERLGVFVRHFFKETLDYDWIWYRFEWQARTAIHAHGVVRLKNDPGICELVEQVCKGRVSAELLEDETEVMELSEDQIELHRIAVLEGEEAERRVISYTDWLQTAMNPRLPEEDSNPEVPDPHPCSVDMNTVLSDPDKREAQYIELCNCVQKHVCRLDGYWKSTKKKGNYNLYFKIQIKHNRVFQFFFYIRRKVPIQFSI